jgi:hypothetical protein
MHKHEKVYNPGDIEKLNREVEELSMKVNSLSDTMINSKPWSVHWLGGDIKDGDIKDGATEVRPARFQAALDAMCRAAEDLQMASHELAMLETETLYPEPEGG